MACTHDWKHDWYVLDGEKEGYERTCQNCDAKEEKNPEMILLMQQPIQILTRKKV